ncbi:unnamed protein product [Anisakis simplex]|uniref:Uncharacterized protein n=1 Tax=Anisakis simplex TaxID=6269 RepID=A0A0M3JRP6_ANISI|nr:unnamed protein product [Anisakis simplex]
MKVMIILLVCALFLQSARAVEDLNRVDRIQTRMKRWGRFGGSGFRRFGRGGFFGRRFGGFGFGRFGRGGFSGRRFGGPFFGRRGRGFGGGW